MKVWNQLKIFTLPQNFEAISSTLLLQGITGIELLPQDQGLTIYLPADQLTHSWQEELQERLQKFQVQPSQYQIEIIKNVTWNWGQQWQPYYHASRISHFMQIVPPWQKELATSPYDLLIDPQESFGTGEHETTKLCLQALEQFCPPQLASLIDVGTGTGILAIAAAKLGVQKIWAYDLDPVAISVAETNFHLNHCQDQIKVRTNSLLDGIDRQVDLITANMLEEPLRQLIPQLAPHLKAQGQVILSGFLTEKTAELQVSLQAEGLKMIQLMQTPTWGCLVLQKQGEDVHATNL
ncbi:50S ribosomal protein L11 methyltransferase [Lactobacillus sp. DCY120]|uniref:Ribosomal protein L11 methyltransferase n=1 Tax=Bombilactobacillus apium TaxID=2675299 RepID=A0A850R4T9_9LACO|nr:50S ribosomal protein L11 methyltransferase [Bombilactobacillus apium]NVY95857.1 50S ribosomal protein L11 methyltransferase [Bombilactobacillus apium]